MLKLVIVINLSFLDTNHIYFIFIDNLAFENEKQKYRYFLWLNYNKGNGYHKASYSILSWPYIFHLNYSLLQLNISEFKLKY